LVETEKLASTTLIFVKSEIESLPAESLSESDEVNVEEELLSFLEQPQEIRTDNFQYGN
jgi:hypothetical protein